MSYHGLPLDDDDQRNRAIAALLVPARKPIEIDYSKEILGELKKMNELMKVQISLLKEIRDTTGRTSAILDGVRQDGVLQSSSFINGLKDKKINTT
jgi:hypothetical protein